VGGIKREVREIHVRLFYRPLCRRWRLPAEEQQLSTAQAHDRLAAIGFRDPAGACGTSARSRGLSRKATIQRHLMPIMIRWFADGVDPTTACSRSAASASAWATPLVPADAARLVRRGRAAHPVLSGRATSAS
jgi:glutamine synthetase adenylyltransferase